MAVLVHFVVFSHPLAAISLRIKLPPSYPDDVLHHISNYALILKIPSVAVVSVKNVSDSAVEELQVIFLFLSEFLTFLFYFLLSFSHDRKSCTMLLRNREVIL